MIRPDMATMLGFVATMRGFQGKTFLDW